MKKIIWYILLLNIDLINRFFLNFQALTLLHLVNYNHFENILLNKN